MVNILRLRLLSKKLPYVAQFKVHFFFDMIFAKSVMF